MGKAADGPMELERAATLLEALGNSTRLRMVVELSRAGQSGLPVAALQERVGIEAKSTASNHLRQLVQAGLVTRERRSTTLLCRISPEVVEGLFAFLAGAVIGGGPGGRATSEGPSAS